MKCIQHILLYLPQTVTCFCNKKKLLSQTVKTSLNFQIKIIITKVKKYTYNICIKNILRAEARVASRIAAMNLILLLQLNLYRIRDSRAIYIHVRKSYLTLSWLFPSCSLQGAEKYFSFCNFITNFLATESFI